jgi:hypothetical protein
MFVTVVMGNDFPESVWEDSTKAEQYVLEKNAADKEEASNPRTRRRRIYWRTYRFEVRV